MALRRFHGKHDFSCIFNSWKVSKISNVAPHSVDFLYSYTSKREVLVLVSFLWGGGFSMFGFIIAHAKNSHVFLRVYWIYWLFWLFWEFWPPKSPLVERTKNFFCNELPPPLQRATPSSATSYPLLCNEPSPIFHVLPIKSNCFWVIILRKIIPKKKIWDIIDTIVNIFYDNLLDFWCVHTSKKKYLVFMSFLWFGGFSLFGFITTHAKNLHVFLRVTEYTSYSGYSGNFHPRKVRL